MAGRDVKWYWEVCAGVLGWFIQWREQFEDSETLFAFLTIVWARHKTTPAYDQKEH